MNDKNIFNMFQRIKEKSFNPHHNARSHNLQSSKNAAEKEKEKSSTFLCKDSVLFMHTDPVFWVMSRGLLMINFISCKHVNFHILQKRRNQYFLKENFDLSIKCRRFDLRFANVGRSIAYSQRMFRQKLDLSNHPSIGLRWR